MLPGPLLCIALGYPTLARKTQLVSNEHRKEIGLGDVPNLWPEHFLREAHGVHIQRMCGNPGHKEMVLCEASRHER